MEFVLAIPVLCARILPYTLKDDDDYDHAAHCITAFRLRCTSHALGLAMERAGFPAGAAVPVRSYECKGRTYVETQRWIDLPDMIRAAFVEDVRDPRFECQDFWHKDKAFRSCHCYGRGDLKVDVFDYDLNLPYGADARLGEAVRAAFQYSRDWFIDLLREWDVLSKEQIHTSFMNLALERDDARLFGHHDRRLGPMYMKRTGWLDQALEWLRVNILSWFLRHSEYEETDKLIRRIKNKCTKDIKSGRLSKEDSRYVRLMDACAEAKCGLLKRKEPPSEDAKEPATKRICIEINAD